MKTSRTSGLTMLSQSDYDVAALAAGFQSAFKNQQSKMKITRCAMKNLAILFTAWLALAAAAVAQEMPKPGPEHKKLDMFAGSWTLAGNMKSSPMGPGGDMSENEKC